MRHHAARPGAVAGERAVHHREDATMDPLLNHQQIHQRFVDHRMRPVAALVEQAAKRVLHRAGCRCEDVGLHSGQVNDVFTDEAARDGKPIRIHVIEAEEFFRQVPNRIADGNPLLTLVQVHVAKAMRLDDIDLFVLTLAEARVDDNGAVVTRVD
jgi:hypothetical protein